MKRVPERLARWLHRMGPDEATQLAFLRRLVDEGFVFIPDYGGIYNTRTRRFGYYDESHQHLMAKVGKITVLQMIQWAAERGVAVPIRRPLRRGKP